jgi:hypothetical protein
MTNGSSNIKHYPLLWADYQIRVQSLCHATYEDIMRNELVVRQFLGSSCVTNC